MNNIVAGPEQTMAEQGAKIKVVGVGGGGGNAVKHMIAKGLKGVDFAILNTDNQAMDVDNCEKIQLGQKQTQGLGAGANPEVGRKAAEESIDAIKESLEGYNMVFVAAGMGGGSGTGAAPVVASVAKDLGILCVGVITLPYRFEQGKRMQKAREGQKNMAEYVDTMITIPNDKLSEYVMQSGKDFSLTQAFTLVDDVLRNAVSGITEVISNPGIINLDFADVKTVMSIRGDAMMGVGVGKGEEKISAAVNEAMLNPLMEKSVQGSRGLLLSIVGNDNLGYTDFLKGNEIVENYVNQEECEYMVGTILDPEMPEDEVRVTVVATGFPGEPNQEGITNNKAAAPTKAPEPVRAENPQPTATTAPEPQAPQQPAPEAPQFEEPERKRRASAKADWAVDDQAEMDDTVEMQMHEIFEGSDMMGFMKTRK